MPVGGVLVAVEVGGGEEEEERSNLACRSMIYTTINLGDPSKD